MRLAWVCAFVLLGCQPAVAELRGRTMGSGYVLRWVDGPRTQVLVPAVRALLDEYEQTFSRYAQDSELLRLNRDPRTEAVVVSDRLARTMRRALHVATISRGAFDPTIAPLVAVHGFGPGGNPAVPASAEQIAAAQQRVGHGRVQVDAQGRVHRGRADMEFDLDAIVPGVAVDELGELMVRYGCRNFLIDIGGEVLARGHRGDGQPWRVGIERAGTETALTLLELEDAALATSGTYRRAVGAQHHVMDPILGRPVLTPVLSVTVRATHCALADALATALLVVGPDRAEAVLAACGDPAAGALFQLMDEPTPRTCRW